MNNTARMTVALALASLPALIALYAVDHVSRLPAIDPASITFVSAERNAWDQRRAWVSRLARVACAQEAYGEPTATAACVSLVMPRWEALNPPPA